VAEAKVGREPRADASDRRDGSGVSLLWQPVDDALAAVAWAPGGLQASAPPDGGDGAVGDLPTTEPVGSGEDASSLSASAEGSGGVAAQPKWGNGYHLLPDGLGFRLPMRGD
jgi:hypothetical protein